MNRKEITLEVLNPVARSSADAVPIAPRISDLNGKTICLLQNLKRPASFVVNAVEESLKRRFKDVKFVGFSQPSHAEINDESLAMIKNGSDLVIGAIGD